jgi:hypothetical protein
MKKAIYIVWGPSPEWGDGVGVIGYAQSLRQAKNILSEERRLEKEYGSRSWRSIDDCGYIEPVPADELGWDGEEPIEKFVEELNDLV